MAHNNDILLLPRNLLYEFANRSDIPKKKLTSISLKILTKRAKCCASSYLKGTFIVLISTGYFKLVELKIKKWI